jgi:hypothetical protein
VNESREIPLSQNLVALVDDEDYDRVMAAGKWSAIRGRSTFYARKSVARPGGARGAISLHTYLTGWPLVDHINGDGLDNRRANLRPATGAQNMHNRRLNRDNKTGFKGVSWDAQRGRWRADINLNGRRKFLGYHEAPEAAAHAYDEAARSLHGEFATVNFPTAGERGAS